MIQHKKGIKSSLSLGTLDSLIKQYSSTMRNHRCREELLKVGITPLVENGRLDYQWALNRQGRRIYLPPDISVEMRRMIIEGEYPEIITEKELFKIL
jgi:hypothetical protein